jgi:hypothetical protein
LVIPVAGKNRRQQNCRAGNVWSPRIPGLLPLLPLLPVFLKPVEHLIKGNPDELAP